MLWLSVHLPHMALDLGRRGIEPGMALDAALSLGEGIHTEARDPQAEQTALRNLAAWAGQFTSLVYLQPPQGLLLEIKGSLALFSGIKRLRTCITAGLRELGYRSRTAVAPTPLGAWLLARAGYEHPVTERTALAAVLRKLPITVLERPEHLLRTLQTMGLRTIGDCLRLPRAGLARRLGPEFVQYLDRALGRMPDLRPAFRPPTRFNSRLPLSAEISDTEALLFAVHRLLLELSGFLQARGSGAQALQLVLYHHRLPPTALYLDLVRPSRDVDHLSALLRERLDRHTLHAPVENIGLEVTELVPLPEKVPDLFSSPRETGRDWPQLVEHLRARLGTEAVHGLCPVPGHRPERTWRYCEPGVGGNDSGRPHRPLWLLREPAPLKACEGLPWLEGRLLLERGPERIESGWWDGYDAARDYFVARNERHERFWVFRELRKPGRWFLHGVFG